MSSHDRTLFAGVDIGGTTTDGSTADALPTDVGPVGDGGYGPNTNPLTGIGNLCGLPALSVPCGFTDKNLPVGLQFVARAGDDYAVIQAARIFQQHTAWHSKHPKIA